ncbi:hypothetical protein [uncultured Aquimarina sp.]|uniref:hypothetical protein n=1 Tax=uncultured Aquimarina sp. TaxID=575652 RepID=UPI002630C243|nr:hypothetical protein [uncultured Aquimarina sp.]
MKSYNYIHTYKILLVCCFGLLLSSCEVEDGATGIDGVNGIDGIDGTDGLGFDEITRFGSITVTLEGTRPDNQSFTDSETFRFGALSPDFLTEGNTVTPNESGLQFNVRRFLSAPDDAFQSASTIFQLLVTNPGEANQIVDFDLQIFNYAVVSEDLTFFDVTSSSVSNADVTDFNFNNETNTLTFSFTADIPAELNTTSNDISVSGEVDVIVLKEIPGLE